MCAIFRINVRQVFFDVFVYSFKFSVNASIIIVIPILELLAIMVFGYVIAIFINKSIHIVSIKQHACNIQLRKSALVDCVFYVLNFIKD